MLFLNSQEAIVTPKRKLKAMFIQNFVGKTKLHYGERESRSLPMLLCCENTAGLHVLGFLSLGREFNQPLIFRLGKILPGKGPLADPGGCVSLSNEKVVLRTQAIE